MSSEPPRDFCSLRELRYIRELAKVLRQHDLDEIELESGERRVLLRRGGGGPAGAPGGYVVRPDVAPYSPGSTPRPAALPAPADSGTFIVAPFVGTFYRAASPGAPAFVEVGATVQRGQLLCIVEAMKLFNEIEAEFPCVIEEILPGNGMLIEHGAKIFRVRRL